MSDRQVIVIGGGAAGCAAALAAAAEGAKVCVVRAALGATALSSGAVDLAADPAEVPGLSTGSDKSLPHAFRRCRASQPDHPLTVAGMTTVRAVDILDGLARQLPLLQRRTLEDPLLRLPTDMGTVKTTTWASHWATGGDLAGLEGAMVGMVGLANHPRHAPVPRCKLLSALASRAGIGLEVRPLEVPLLRLRGDERAGPAALAAMVERPAALDRLCQDLERQAGQARLSHLLLPPVMGLYAWAKVHRRISRIRPAAELLSGPPSVPGLRLQAALDGALYRAGITLIHGRAAGLIGAGPGITAVSLSDGRELRGQAFVLATGKFIGGGLVHDKDGLVEPLAGLPVWAGRDGPNPGNAAKLMARQAHGPHPLWSAGLRFDPALRPLARGGEPFRENLYGAGSVLGGYDYIAGRDGLGTAMVTGHLAGTAAALGEQGRSVRDA